MSNEIEYIEEVCRLEKTKLAGTGLDGHLNGILAMLPSLRAQLTTALAERDEAREQRDYFKSCANTNTQEAAGIMRQIGQALGLEVNAPWSEIVACSIKCVAERDRLAAQLNTVKRERCEMCDLAGVETDNLVGTAWQQGAEAMREAAAEVAEDYDRKYPGHLDSGLTLRQWVAKQIRALPVPTRKETEK